MCVDYENIKILVSYFLRSYVIQHKTNSLLTVIDRFLRILNFLLNYSHKLYAVLYKRNLSTNFDDYKFLESFMILVEMRK